MTKNILSVPEVGQGWALIRNRCFSHMDVVRELALDRSHELIQPSFSFAASNSFTTAANHVKDSEFPDASWVYMPREHDEEVSLDLVDLYKVMDLLSEDSFEKIKESPRAKNKVNKAIKLGNYHRIRLDGSVTDSALEEVHSLCDQLCERIVLYRGSLLIKDNNRISLRLPENGSGTEYLREVWTKII